MLLDNRFPMVPTAPQPLQPQTRKQPGLNDQQPLFSWGPRSDLAKLLELPPREGVFPGKPGHGKVQEALLWEVREARPTVVGGKKRENASPECATPSSAADSSEKGFVASDPAPCPRLRTLGLPTG